MAIQRQLHLTNRGKKFECHETNECHYFYHKQDKKCRWRTNVKKTNICTVKAIASGTIFSSTNQEGHYKQRS